ncbi:MAG: hypothetical protein HFI34_03460 [Lachnospiraceae bacterium]|nr:hypothetical protein [Lachnospiraceae bacterium]
MDIIREIVKNINEREYTNIKIMIMNESDRYIRDCSFVREIIFDSMGEKYGIPAVLNRQSADKDSEDERLEFRIQMNRYDSSELYLYVKAINGSIVNEKKTKLTKTEVSHILEKDYKWMADTDNAVVNQLAMQMKYNYCYPMVIREYFQENFYNIYRKELLTLESMELYLENDVQDFFNDNLSPMREMDYNNIKLYYQKKITMPAIGFAGSMK